MPGSAAATGDVERLIESRLQEIEEQLKPFTELERERSRLRRALDALRDSTGEEPGETSLRSRPQRGRPKRRRARVSGRAPRGSNLSAILDYVARNRGATAGEISEATGISRGVVYSATSRLAVAGRLKRSPKSDGQVGYEVQASG